MKCNVSDLPPINGRIKEIIDKNFFGNVNRFSSKIGFNDSSKVNRLFNLDKKKKIYPTPSIDIILSIANTLGYSTDWLLFGKKILSEEEEQKLINEKVNNAISKTHKELIDIIKQQSLQISKLMELNK